MTGFTPELVERVSAAIQPKHYHEDRALAALEASGIAELTEALAPSGDTKAAYMGEFSFSITDTAFDDEAEEFIERQRKVYVPWDTIKEIMAAIRERAKIASNHGSPGGSK